MSEGSDTFLYWVLGGSLVMIYAVQRFNTPPSNRLSTTRPRYFLALSLYLTVMAFLFVMLGGGLTSSPEIKEFLVKAEILPEAWGGSGGRLLPGPLISALILSTLLPNTKLAAFDRWLCKVCWDIGRIPRAARTLGQQMRRSGFKVPVLFQEEVRKRLDGFNPKDIRFDPETSIQHDWTKITALYVIVTDWEHQGIPKHSRDNIEGWSDKQREAWEHYERVPDLLKEEYTRIKRQFELMRPRARNLFSIEQEYNEEQHRDVVSECERSFRDKADELYRALTHFVAQGILRCEHDAKAQIAAMRQMGFQNIREIAQPAMPIDLIACVSVGVFAAFIFVIALGAQLAQVLGIDGDVFGGSGGSRLPITAVMVAIIYGLAVVAAIYPKAISKSLDRRRTPGRRWLSYVLSGIIAVCLATLTVLTFRFLLLFDFAKAVQSIYWSGSWLWMTFFTGACTAFLADDFAESKSVPKWARWAEGAAMAVILVFVAIVLVFPGLEFRLGLVNNSQLIPKWVGNEVPEWFFVPPYWAVLPISAAIGFLIGFLVPHEYRRRPIVEPTMERDEEPDGNLAHQAY